MWTSALPVVAIYGIFFATGPTAHSSNPLSLA